MPDNKQEVVDVRKQIESEQTKLKELANSLMPNEALEVVKVFKSQGGQPYATQIGDQFFIYRILSRAEYKAFLIEQTQVTQKLVNEAENQTVGSIVANIKTEDSLVCKCVLWPQVDEISIKTYPAGYIETLHRTIMNTSGFNIEVVTVKL